MKRVWENGEAANVFVHESFKRTISAWCFVVAVDPDGFLLLLLLCIKRIEWAGN